MAAKRSNRRIDTIWMIAREYAGLAETGGVKDVCRQLAEALARSRKKVRVVLPLYGFMAPENLGFTKPALSFEVDMNYAAAERREKVAFWSRAMNGVTVYLVDADRFREKKGIYTYSAAEEAADVSHRQGTGHFDYFATNVLLQKASIGLMVSLGEVPDIIHCHDGHTAILPAMIRELDFVRQYFRGTGAVVTIHNAGSGYHQEVGDLPFAGAVCGLPAHCIQGNLLANSFDPLLAASSYAVMNTVSENYARELQETDDDKLTGWLGHRLLARGVRLQGVTNGFNPDAFSPADHDRLGLAAAFDPAAGDLAGKKACRKELCRITRQDEIAGVDKVGSLDFRPDQPLFSMIGRLMSQKGLDILLGALAELLPIDRKFQIIVQGTGAREIEEQLAALAANRSFQGRICFLRGYEPAMANRIFAAGDFFLIPSRYEPCGLTDYMAQLMGNIPVVHHVGGLVKVLDGKTGFAFTEYSAEALGAAMIRVMRVYRHQPDMIAEIQKAAVRHIAAHYTWDKVMKRYMTLYGAALKMASDKKTG